MAKTISAKDLRELTQFVEYCEEKVPRRSVYFSMQNEYMQARHSTITDTQNSINAWMRVLDPDDTNRKALQDLLDRLQKRRELLREEINAIKPPPDWPAKKAYRIPPE
ncbi:MAG TPA: hypothetical protein VLI92_05245 [Candidatus Saccharimonadales bacterium]|nr:hypothetical protein [Candidatus Saccharimonadales bacterium]